MNPEMFLKFSRWVSRVAGQPATFILAVVLILIWAITGPLFHYSNTWQLVINTSTTIITFLMVFLIQSTQNRDSQTVQLKLNELIRSIEGAQNKLLALEDASQEEMDEMRSTYVSLVSDLKETDTLDAVASKD